MFIPSVRIPKLTCSYTEFIFWISESYMFCWHTLSSLVGDYQWRGNGVKNRPTSYVPFLDAAHSGVKQIENQRTKPAKYNMHMWENQL